jgi:ketosteroid isomerase-like protein
MSTNNAGLIRQGFEAFLKGDFDALRDLMKPDAQWLGCRWEANRCLLLGWRG